MTAKVPCTCAMIFIKVSDNSSYQTLGNVQGKLISPNFRDGSGKRTFRMVSWNKLPTAC